MPRRHGSGRVAPSRSAPGSRTGSGGMDTVSAINTAVRAQSGRGEALFEDLARCGRTDPGVTPASYSPEGTQAQGGAARCAAALGLAIGRDAAANTTMTLPGRDRSLPPILIGSHLDTVAQGGNFDGAAGVVAGLAAVAALRELGLTPARDITVMAIRAEESVWFQVSYIGSRAALGTLPDGALDAARIDSGLSLAAHIAREGGDPEALRSGPPALAAAAIHAFLEVHIEQAPSLEEAGIPVGLCTGI